MWVVLITVVHTKGQMVFSLGFCKVVVSQWKLCNSFLSFDQINVGKGRLGRYSHFYSKGQQQPCFRYNNILLLITWTVGCEKKKRFGRNFAKFDSQKKPAAPTFFIKKRELFRSCKWRKCILIIPICPILWSMETQLKVKILNCFSFNLGSLTLSCVCDTVLCAAHSFYCPNC